MTPILIPTEEGVKPAIPRLTWKSRGQMWHIVDKEGSPEVVEHHTGMQLPLILRHRMTLGQIKDEAERFLKHGSDQDIANEIIKHNHLNK
jgi:hypothetical protein